jgi:hypothetical protein
VRTFTDKLQRRFHAPFRAFLLLAVTTWDFSFFFRFAARGFGAAFSFFSADFGVFSFFSGVFRFLPALAIS